MAYALRDDFARSSLRFLLAALVVSSQVSAVDPAAAATLPAAPAPGAGSPLSPSDERALGDDLLFCAALTNSLSKTPGESDAWRKSWEQHGRWFFALAATLVPPTELEAATRAAVSRANVLIRGEANGIEELKSELVSCTAKLKANKAWIMERSNARGSGDAEGKPGAKDLALTYGDVRLLHRWSREGQHEFTPSDQPDLERWTRMVTIDVRDKVTDGEGLAQLANAVLTSYQRAGRIVRTASRPRTDAAPAQRFVSAVLNGPGVRECAFARFLLHEGQGVVVVSSYRFYGDAADKDAAAWLAQHAEAEEATLMRWDGLPSLAALRGLASSPP